MTARCRVAAVMLAACGGTSAQKIAFDVAAGGPAEGVPPFDTQAGWHVALKTARLHVGAIYLDPSAPTDSCGTVGGAASEVAGVDVDVLSRSLQPFPMPGEATGDAAANAEVWLVAGGDVDAPTDVDPGTGQPAIVVAMSGTASNSLLGFTFSATITIGPNRATADPICTERIVTPIPVDVTPRDGGTLALRVDPARWFAKVDFAELAPPDYRFPDDLSIPASQNLFAGLHDPGGYELSFH